MPSDNSILLVGLPRSGTSWVGAVLGSSPTVDYLREPITQDWLDDEGIGTVTIDASSNPEYAAVAHRVLDSGGRRRLIKEVNPYLIPFAAPQRSITTVLLHRHPCAVALSQKERKWTRLDMDQRFGVTETGDFWYDHGAFQALLLRPVMDMIRDIGHVVSYEKLTADPGAEFEVLAGRLGLDWSAASREYLASTLSDHRPADPYSVTRDAAGARDRWMVKLDDSQKTAVVAGYKAYRRRGLPTPTTSGYRNQSRKLTYWRGSR